MVDSGFSFTHIAPYCRNKKMKEGIRRSEISHCPPVTTIIIITIITSWVIVPSRVNVGGKLLTNHLKEIISYRSVPLRSVLWFSWCFLTEQTF